MGRIGWIGWGVAVSCALWGARAGVEAQQSGAPGHVVGRVFDQATGEPLGRAHLHVVDTDIEGPAGPDGRFALPPLTPGRIEVRFTHPGYVPRHEVLEIIPGEIHDVRVGLAADSAFVLEPIVVTVRSRVLERRGFYERRSQGYAARYFEREDILARDPQNLSELFLDLPGAKVIPGGLDGPQIVFQRATDFRNSGVCRPALFMDGVRSGIRLYDMILDPVHVEGIEVYVGASIPGRFNDPCGAILIWTR